MEASYVNGVAPIKGSFPLDSFGAHHVETNRRGVTAVNNDVLDDPLCERRAWEAIDTRSFVCAPMSRNGRLIAALYVNYREPHVWDPEDIRLVEEVAARIWEAMERSRSEAALLALNATLEEMVEQRTHERDRTWRLSPVLMIVGDENGKILQVNPAWNKGLGWTSDETLGRDIMEFVAPEDWAFGAAGMAQLSRGEPVVDYKLNMIAKDGRRRTIAWTTVPEAERLHAFGRDITEQMLAEDHLRQAQKMDALGQLTGGIAHDFNNLLQGVTGSLDLIRRQPADEAKVRRLAEAGLRAAERGSKLTSQLLAFSRAQELELQPVVISDLVVNMSDLFDRTLGPNVRVRLDLDPRNLAARCDPTQLEMAILNLAINARDAMAGDGELTIGVRRVSVSGNPALADGDYMEVSVRDTGSGMPPEVAERAFDPFFTTKGAGKGTGLGLSQVYGSAKYAGGGARIESRLGEGTTVRIFLPQTVDIPTPGVEPNLPSTVLSTGASTVLVVDDDADVRAFLIASLRSLGFRTVEAEDGHTGLAALDRWRPDAMILDFAMPGMTGAQVAAVARSRRPDFPIIFTSGYSDTAAISEIPGSPTPLLRKPFKVEDLEGVLARALLAPSAD
jgi:PAS domain S-box-containing protein